MSFSTITVAKVASISIALLASGGDAAFSLFDVPELQSQPASRSLPQIRWLFSRGSHIFPQAAFISSAGFAYLAFNALPMGTQTFMQLASQATKGGPVSGYLAAAVLTISIAPWTALVMIPTNFKLIKMNEDMGGARSAESAKQGDTQPGQRSAIESVDGQGQAGEFTDLSGPQGKTKQYSSEEDDRRASELLGKFARLNNVRAVLLGLGGIVGLTTAVAA